jgi:hypothetical protein
LPGSISGGVAGTEETGFSFLNGIWIAEWIVAGVPFEFQPMLLDFYIDTGPCQLTTLDQEW